MLFRNTQKLMTLVLLAGFINILYIETAEALWIQRSGINLRITIRIQGLSFDPVDEFYAKSSSIAVDDSFSGAQVTGSPGIGTWNYEYVDSTHDGFSLPEKSIHFFLVSGDGISAGEEANFLFRPTTMNPYGWLADYHDTDAPDPGWFDDQIIEVIPEPGGLALYLIGFAALIRRFTF